MDVAQWIVNLTMIYAGSGLLFAVVFVIFGIGQLDAGAKGATVFFRLLIVPGAAALWPLLLTRWLRGQTHLPVERNVHRSGTQGEKP